MPISRINTNSIANNTIQGADLLDASITAAKIISVANTQLTGNIVSSQITSIGGSQITANTIANSAFQTGSVENYMNATGLSFGMRNRIINGAMVIDQRNAGAAVTANGAFPVDRFTVSNGTDGAFSAQQDSSAPAGFIKSTKITITTADTSLAATQALSFIQRVEGFNVADLNWGGANAKTITISFWVRSSLTGTFGGALRNDNANRSYPFTYSISVANTWEQKSVTIAGDTSGTWATDNSSGIVLFLTLGAGADRSGTAGAWNSNTNSSATGAVSVVGTINATWYITGLQLEVGSTATSFDYRPYGTELQLCQRYCHVFRSDAVATFSNIGFATVYSNTDQHVGINLPVSMRTVPTVSYSSISHLAIHLPGVVRVTLTAASVNTNQSGNYRIVLGTNTASSGDLVSHKSAHCEFNGTSVGWLAFSAEL